MARRTFDVEALIEEDRAHLLNCAADLGTFFAQAAFTLVANAISPKPQKHEHHPDQQFGIGWVADFLGVSAQTVRNRIADGQLRAVRSAEGKFRVRWEDIRQYQESGNGFVKQG